MIFTVVQTFACTPPVAQISCLDPCVSVGETLYISDGDSYDPDNEGQGTGIVAYEWIFPPEAYYICGRYSKDAKCKFYPARESPYVITLKVTDDEGVSSQTTEEITVESASTTEWFVKANGGDDKDGSCWDDAFRSIQVGISSAAEDETVIVGEGVYNESIDFHGGDRDITVKSTAPADPDIVANTIIDGVGLSSVVTFEGSETSSCTLTGFTIRDGGLKDYAPSSIGLKAHWKFDDASGDTECDSASDSSAGGEKGGTLTDMDTTNDWVLGKGCGNALNFDGEDGYVSVDNHDDFDVGGALTVSHWFKTTINQSGVAMVTRGGSLDYKYTTSLSDSSGNLVFGIRQSSGPTSVQTEDLGAGYWADGNWHHIAGVFDKSASERLKIYIDGKVVDSDPAYDEDISNSDQGIDIGRWEDEDEFEGTIDEVLIYDRALSASEIVELANIRGPIGHWKLDESDTTSTANDSSDNNNNGTLSVDMDGTEWNIDGKFGNALEFDGSNDYVDLDVAKSLKHPLPITLAAWIRINGTSTRMTVICLGDEINTHYGLTLLVDESDHLWACLGDGTGGTSTSRRIESGEINLDTYTWRHVAVVATSPEDLRLYVDGQRDEWWRAGTGGDIVYSNGNSSIGARNDGAESFFVGEIDDVRVYDKALSAKEINQLYRGGGGIYGNNTEATISKCVITDNSALEGGGIAAFDGEISNCAIEDNSADHYGGGVLNMQASPDIANCEIKGNSAVLGGGIFNYGIDPDWSLTDVTNCLFIENEAVLGGAICNKNDSWDLITNCTFSKNNASTLGGAIYNLSSWQTDIENSILWGDTDSTADNWEVISDDSWIGISYSDLGNVGTLNGGTINPGSGNLTTDPLFADADNGDFHLQSAVGRWNGSSWVTTDTTTSWCVDAGNPASSYSNEPDYPDGHINMGVYGNTTEASKSDAKMIIYVDCDNTTSPWLGTASDPYKTIQDGVDDVRSKGIVYVADGTYYENLSFDSGDDFSLIGVSYPIIDGDADDSVIYFNNADNMIVDGFYIIHGVSAIGGGMLLSNSSATIKNCRFWDNWAYNDAGAAWGGGIYIDGDSPLIENCDFVYNLAYGNNPGIGWWGAGNGGAVYVDMSTATFKDCTMGLEVAWVGSPYGNDADDWVNSYGAPVTAYEVYILDYLGSPSPTFTNCSIRNEAYYKYTDGGQH